MPRSSFAVVVGVLAVSMAGCGSSGSSSGVAGASPAAQTACGAIAEGSSSSIAACAQGYDAAKAGKTEETACSKAGAGAIVVGENVKDCLSGWSAAGTAGKTAAASPSPAAQTACGAIAERCLRRRTLVRAPRHDAAKAGVRVGSARQCRSAVVGERSTIVSLAGPLQALPVKPPRPHLALRRKPPAVRSRKAARRRLPRVLKAMTLQRLASLSRQRATVLARGQLSWGRASTIVSLAGQRAES